MTIGRKGKQPSDPFAAWQAATRAILAVLSPNMPATSVRFKLADGRCIELLVDTPLTPAHDEERRSAGAGDFEPSPLQVRILQHLLEGAKSPKQVRERTAGRLYDPRGIQELLELGIVEKNKLGRYCLTSDVGREIAEALGDELE